MQSETSDIVLGSFTSTSPGRESRCLIPSAKIPKDRRAERPEQEGTTTPSTDGAGATLESETAMQLCSTQIVEVSPGPWPTSGSSHDSLDGSVRRRRHRNKNGAWLEMKDPAQTSQVEGDVKLRRAPRRNDRIFTHHAERGRELQCCSATYG